MAKGNVRGDDNGRVKFRMVDFESMRLVDFEVEGSAAAIEDGLKNIASSLVRSGAPGMRMPTTPKTLAASVSRNAALPIENEQERPAKDAVESQIAEEPLTEMVEEKTDETPKPKSTRPRGSKPRMPNVLDIDFGTGDGSFEAFYAQKKPDSFSDKAVLIAAWLKEQRQIEEITIDHLHTAFKLMKWTEPDDLGAVLRDLRGRLEVFEKGSARGSYKINRLGMQHVAKMNAS
jgi:hypothetical protein